MNQKSIRITSAGIAAQKSSKSSWLARHALILAIPMLCAVSSVIAQTKFKIDSSYKNYSFRPLTIMDSSRMVAYLNKDSSLIVIDSLATIKVMIYCAFQSSKTLSDYQERFWAAADILNYLKVDGTISNKKKFDVAVKKYRALMSK